MSSTAAAPDALDAILARVAADAGLWSDFNAICDCGGRVAGSPSEAHARELTLARLAATGGRAWLEHVPYPGWRAGGCALRLPDGSPLTCQPMLGAAATTPAGALFEVMDLGRGTPEDFALHARRIPGRAVMVRHEYPFSADHIHRRRKYDAAVRAGAGAFIIANPYPGASPTSGSSGRNGGAGIPAIATDAVSAARIVALPVAQVHLTLAGEDFSADAATPMLDLPGRDPAHTSRIVLSAHLDGHPLGESAMDNASGLATVLSVARAVAPVMSQARHGLRVCLFTAEEWGLSGSREWMARMTPEARALYVLNLNVDTVGADPHLTALTSGFAGLEPFVRAANEASGQHVAIHAPPMPNSDHANFAAQGIPALRLVAGFDRPQSEVRHILTAQDTRDKVAQEDLRRAALFTAHMVWRALCASGPVVASWR